MDDSRRSGRKLNFWQLPAVGVGLDGGIIDSYQETLAKTAPYKDLGIIKFIITLLPPGEQTQSLASSLALSQI